MHCNHSHIMVEDQVGNPTRSGEAMAVMVSCVEDTFERISAEDRDGITGRPCFPPWNIHGISMEYHGILASTIWGWTFFFLPTVSEFSPGSDSVGLHRFQAGNLHRRGDSKTLTTRHLKQQVRRWQQHFDQLQLMVSQWKSQWKSRTVSPWFPPDFMTWFLGKFWILDLSLRWYPVCRSPGLPWWALTSCSVGRLQGAIGQGMVRRSYLEDFYRV